VDANGTREQIVQAADKLFYQSGFEHTSFSDIAELVNISRGNFYHHFKSKDQILDAVIQLRLDNTRKMLNKWEAEANSPEDCIRSFIHILIVNGKKIKRFGCPVGTLNAELGKLNHASKREAKKLFTLFRQWLRQHFLLLGCGDEADKFAMHLLARSQGVATLASTFADEVFIQQEVQQMCDWLRSIAKSYSKNSAGE